MSQVAKKLAKKSELDYKTTKHFAVWDWLNASRLFEYTFFNFSSAENGDVVFAPDDIIQPTSEISDDVIQGYIDGSKEKEYILTAIFFLPIETQPNTDKNLEWASVVENVANWVQAQNDLGNFPNFGEKCIIERVETVQASDGISGADETGAKYQFSIRIIYRDITNARA